MMDKQAGRNRIWELDFFRGIALILMILFHIIFDLKDLYGFDIEYQSGFYYYVGKAAAILFMLISGISCNLSRSNTKRGLKVLGIALVITVVTHLYGQGLGIKFGILHFLGLSMLISPILKKASNIVLLVLAVLPIIIGNIFTSIIMPNDYFFIFNLISSNFTSSDYYPLIPWIGVFIFGIVLGRLLYKEKKSVFRFSLNENIISMAGKHTLIVYVIHQPLILLILSLLSKLLQ